MTSRSLVFVFLLMVLAITSQFEWKQQLVSETEGNPVISRKKQYILDRQETIKEKIILSQEKNIRRLNELVRSLQSQLLHCRGINDSTVHASTNPLADDAE